MKGISNTSNVKLVESIKDHSPKLSSIPSTVSGLAVTSVPWLRLLLHAWYEADASLFGSNKDIHTDSEWTRTDLGLDSSRAWQNNLPTKLIPGTSQEKWTWWQVGKEEVWCSKVTFSHNKLNEKTNLGLHIFAARAGGAHRVTAERISAAFACTSGESCLVKVA